MHRKILAAALAATAIMPAAAWGATSQDYRRCDGYGAASSGGDGMTEIATVGFIFNPPGYGNTDRARIATDAMAAAAGCNAALAELPPEYWMRKVSLLRARALHRLDTLDETGAKADLDAAEAAVQPGNAYFDRSLGWGLAMARAYVMIKTGDRAGGEALAMSTLALRPYNRQTVISAMNAVGAGASDEDRQTILRDLATLMPVQMTPVYLEAFDRAQYDTVIALHAYLSPPVEISNDPRETEREELAWRNFRTAQSFLAATDGRYAYALAATGRTDEARAALDGARARLARETEAPPPLSDKDSKDRELVALHDGLAGIRLRVAAENKDLLDEWSKQVERRIAVALGHADEVYNAMPQTVLPADASTLELLDAMGAKLPPEKRPPPSFTSGLRARLAQNDKIYAFKNWTPQDLLDDAPEAEAVGRVAPYEESVKPFLAMTGSPADLNEEGFRVGTPAPDGSILVGFRGMQSTESMVEETALLRAADLARKAGKKGLVVTDRMDVRHTLSTGYYGVTMRTDPQGYYCGLTVRFVDAGDPQYRDTPWRVLDADAVYGALAPIYILPKKK